MTSQRLLPGSTTPRVEQLVKRKLVSRRQDPESRRRVLVTLTASGRALIDRVLPQLAEALSRPFAGLSKSARDDIELALRSVMHALEAALAEGDDER